MRPSSIDREASGSSGCQGSSLPQSIGVPMIQWLASACQGSKQPSAIDRGSDGSESRAALRNTASANQRRDLMTALSQSEQSCLARAY